MRNSSPCVTPLHAWLLSIRASSPCVPLFYVDSFPFKPFAGWYWIYDNFFWFSVQVPYQLYQICGAIAMALQETWGFDKTGSGIERAVQCMFHLVLRSDIAEYFVYLPTEHRTGTTLHLNYDMYHPAQMGVSGAIVQPEAYSLYHT